MKLDKETVVYMAKNVGVFVLAMVHGMLLWMGFCAAAFAIAREFFELSGHAVLYIGGAGMLLAWVANIIIWSPVFDKISRSRKQPVKIQMLRIEIRNGVRKEWT